MISDLVYKLVGLVSKGWSWWWEAANKVDKLTPAILSLSFVTLAIFWYQWTSKISRKGTPPLPPGPRGLPLVGYLPFLGSDLHRSFSELAHVYGPIMKLQLGYKLCVVLSSPSLAKEVLRDQDITFANRDQPIAALAITYGGLDIAWSQYGPYWRMIRKVCVREMLSNSSLDSSYALRRHEVRKTVRDVYTKIDTPLNISELMFQTVLEVVMSMMWGGALGGGDSSVRAEFREMSGKMVELVGKLNISDLFPILAPFDLQGIEREMKKLLVGIDRIFDPIIDDRLKLNEEKGEQASKNQGNKDLLQFLLKLNEQGDTERPLTRTEMKAILLDISVGGTDTTSTTVEWVMAELMQHPEVMRRAQEELDDVVGVNNIVEESHLPKLQYLDAIVKETLRLHPAFSLLIPHCPSLSCIVGGYTVPKGTRVFLNVWAMQRDPQVWNNPLEFQPERFLRDASGCDYSGNNFNYLPFGSGRRICAGITLAQRMLMYVLASLLHSFMWQLPKDTQLDLTEKFGIVLKKKISLIAVPTPRLSNLEVYV